MWQRAVALAVLTLATVLVHGYHPLAEDGGLYVEGVEYRLTPSLFPHDRAFVTAHLSYSTFSGFVAGAVRWLGVPLGAVLLVLYAAGTAATLYAAWRVARRMFAPERAAGFAVALFAAWFTLPIAGTSLLLMDPYVTARTFSTPLSLLAISFVLERQRGWLWSLGWAAVCLLVAALFHPLMAAYAAGFVAACGVGSQTGRRWLVGWVRLGGAAGAVATLVVSLWEPETAAARSADVSRYYWFLAQWQWYELAGLGGPVLVLGMVLWVARGRMTAAAKAACRAAIGVGVIATAVAVVFARESLRVHEVARLQPLRVFLLVYAVMIVALGGILSEWAGARRGRVAGLCVVIGGLGGVMGLVQRQTFPASQHLELPWRPPVNRWSQAFVWVREHVPADALFAVDAHYIGAAGADAQSFRATAQRSVLADFSKDGGEAAITPALAEAWLAQSMAQTDLNSLNDAQREERLRPFGVTWVVLSSTAQTRRRCPYDNGVVKVCASSLPVPPAPPQP